MQPDLYIGLMSGTSLDGVDAVLVDFSKQAGEIVAGFQQTFSKQMRQRLVDLCQPEALKQSTLDELTEFMLIDRDLADVYANTCLALLKKAGISSNQIKAIGSHGQTLRHFPQHKITLQAGDPNRLAWLTGITTVADFRRKDIAAGGQGAPFAPAFHQQCFHDTGRIRLIANIGGISNITLLRPDLSQLTGYDTGPGNILMDAWIQLKRSLPYDDKGQWAASGKPLPELLQALLAHSFFNKAPPKSTGREEFNLTYLQTVLDKLNLKPADHMNADIQRTLLEFTAVSLASACKQALKNSRIDFPDYPADLILCGGGNHNDLLLQRLTEILPELNLLRCDELGIPSQQLEAMAFAWFAKQRIEERTNPLTQVTGAQQDVIGGGVYLPG